VEAGLSLGWSEGCARFAHPVFYPVRRALALLAAQAEWPDCARLNALAADLGREPCTRNGLPVRFVPPSAADPGYELRVHASGAVATRARNWHDLFNALAWFAFPRTKASLNALHASEPPARGDRRGATRDLLTIFDEGGALRVRNIGEMAAHGIGVRVGRRIGRAFNGTVTYTFGRATHPAWPGPAVDPLGFEEAQFHDLVARFETFINWTDTRVAALYRLNTLSDESGAPVTRPGSSTTRTRFDLQVTQGLPFMQPLTRADWELLVAVSNIFYEASEGGLLDELTVQEPPTRVVGGVSVRF